MKNIVYILGAGFSKPLGLPLMNDFWQKSKDMIQTDSEKYGYFKTVHDKINQLDSTYKYFDYDSHNLEDVLSVLEVSETIGEGSNLDLFKKYIVDVIRYNTPEMIRPVLTGFIEQNWRNLLFGDEKWQWYGYFVSSLQGLIFELKEKKDALNRNVTSVEVRTNENRSVHYDVITLNYDLVLESICTYIRTYYKSQGVNVHFYDGVGPADSMLGRPFLVKIHGSVEGGKIIPMTYNKGLHMADLPPLWKVAYDVLMKAHEIRFIGYSLPQTDAYIKYLLKASIAKANELERIDVICRDSKGEVKKRYDEFIQFDNYEFTKESTENYLGYNYQLRDLGGGKSVLKFDRLETAHKEFKERYR
jgi:hypothetical protein